MPDVERWTSDDGHDAPFAACIQPAVLTGYDSGALLSFTRGRQVGKASQQPAADSQQPIADSR